MHLLLGNISLHFSDNSEASASDITENVEGMLIVNRFNFNSVHGKCTSHIKQWLTFTHRLTYNCVVENINMLNI